MDVSNCPSCGALFVPTKFRDVCVTCYKEEEIKFDIVYNFIRKSSNRTATIQMIVEATGVEEALILKFIKTGKIRTSMHPNLGYECEKCGAVIQNGRICSNCSDSIHSELKTLKKEEQRQQELKGKEKKSTYFTKD